ncbi:PepSY domain-containing protein [Rhodopila sp.]|uniref:PepSY domain-containing protein n=1 Tax=Rhodopila sp. TaxID=2480087 RepID=UPI003D12043E
MIIKHVPAIGLAGVLLLGFAGPTLAATNNEAREETALQGTRITLSQAISAAEQQSGGKAFDAGADVVHGKPRVVVETNGPTGVQTVIIDAQSGQIIGGHKGGETD